MRNIARLPLFLAVALCTPACFPALLGVGAGLVISHDVLDNNSYVAHVSEDAALTWAIAKSALTHQASDPITVNDDLRRAKAKVDGANVTVSVETYDEVNCRLMVSANKFGVNDGEVAESTIQQLLTALHEARN